MPSLRRTVTLGANQPPGRGLGAGFGPAYRAATGEAPPWCPYRSNPTRTAKISIRPAARGHACPPHQHWDENSKRCVPDASRSVSVGACFPKFDPLEMYGVGRPPAQVLNPAPAFAPVAQGPFQLPALDPSTGLPRLRGLSWRRR